MTEPVFFRKAAGLTIAELIGLTGAAAPAVFDEARATLPSAMPV